MGKTKLFVGLVLLIVGAGLIPTGIILDNRINDDLDAAIPGALLQIRDGFLPGMAELVKFENIPEGLIELKSGREENLPSVINGSISAQTINETIFTLGDTLGDDAIAKNMFFNDPAWSTTTGGVFPINSISEVMGQALGFTAEAQDNILYGVGTYPGLISDLVRGSGIWNFMQAFAGATTNQTKLILTNVYNSTIEQLGNVSAYLSSYLIPQAQTLGSLPFPADSTYASYYFHSQWTNATLNHNGIPVPTSRNGEIIAWELGVDYVNDVAVYNPSNFSLALSMALWDATNGTSPINTTSDSNDGFHYWYSASMNTTRALELQTIYGIDQTQFDLITEYLFGVEIRDRVHAPFIGEARGLSFADVVLNYFYLQWSTGIIIPNGLVTWGPEFALLDGIEVILPEDNTADEPFYLGLTRCRNMWDPENTVALTNERGIVDWLTLMRIEAPTDAQLYVEIQSSIEFPIVESEFDISRSDVVYITNWLRNFRYNILPKLALESGQYFLHPTELANLVSIVGITAGGFLGFVGIILIFAYRKR